MLKKYKHFINESVNSDKEAKSLNDIPNEVTEIAKEIANSVYDRVKKPLFEYEPGVGLVMTFSVTEQDYKFVNTTEQLYLDSTENFRNRKKYEVTLNYLESIVETFQLKYLVKFDLATKKPANIKPAFDLDEDEDDY